MKPFYIAIGALLTLALSGCGGSGGNGGGGGEEEGIQGKTGRIYFSDGGFDKVYRMDNIDGGNWTSFAGPGGNDFNLPWGMSFDSQGRIYIADWGHNRIVRMDDMSGAGWITFGTAGTGVGQLDGPTDVVIDKNDRIYIADTDNDRIVRIDDITGAGWVAFGTQGSDTNELSGPYGLAVGEDLRIYICDSFNERIVKINDMTGAGWTVFTDPKLDTPSDIQVYGNKMLICDRSGNFVALTDLMAATNWQQISVNQPQCANFGNGGKLFVASEQDDRIYEYSSITDTTPKSYGGDGDNPMDGPGYVLIGP